MLFKRIKSAFYGTLHWLLNLPILPPWYKWWVPHQLLVLYVHRSLLQIRNLFPAPGINKKEPPCPIPSGRPDDGRGTDRYYPEAGSTGSRLGRNVPAVPVAERDPRGSPDVQLIAQKLLQRKPNKILPATDFFNVLAAAWIQAQVHDWIGHYDGDKDITLDKGKESGCPMAKFVFKNTKPRPDDDSFDSFRSNWWDSSFVYGQTKEAVDRARTFKNGQLKVNTTNPNMLPRKGDIAIVGDNKNSWVGVALLQEIFLREHNAVAKVIAENHKELNDQEVFERARLVVSAVQAKVHTVDWTIELLKTKGLKVGMRTNWYGLPRAIGLPNWIPPVLSLIGHKKPETHGVPYCLTEDFGAVYRLHPMLPDGLIISGSGSAKEEFIPMTKLLGASGDKEMLASPDRPVKFWESVLKYPCGGLLLHNYPIALRQVNPTDDEGRPLPDSKQVDLAALDLYRDRERGIPRFNDFRRALALRPYKSWKELTGEEVLAAELAEVYDNIEDCDLLVGDLAEKKIPGFAISETSFIIFLLMASRRLESDPFLNTYFTEEHYSSTGLKWIEDTSGMRDLLKRHYPELEKELPPGQSAFVPYAKWPAQYTNGTA